MAVFLTAPSFNINPDNITSDDIKYNNPQKPEIHTVSGAIEELFGSKVDKIPGKGLSTNDYTDEDKHKVDTLAGQLYFSSYMDFPPIGQEGILYIATDKNTSYLWNSTEMVYVSMTIDDADTAYTIQGIL